MLCIITEGEKIIFLTVQKEKILLYSLGCQLMLIHFVNVKVNLFAEKQDSMEVKTGTKCQVNYFVVPQISY